MRVNPLDPARDLIARPGILGGSGDVAGPLKSGRYWIQMRQGLTSGLATSSSRSPPIVIRTRSARSPRSPRICSACVSGL